MECMTFHGRNKSGEDNLIWDGREQYTLLAGSMIRTEKASTTLQKGDMKFRRENAGLFISDGNLSYTIAIGIISV